MFLIKNTNSVVNFKIGQNGRQRTLRAVTCLFFIWKFYFILFIRFINCITEFAIFLERKLVVTTFEVLNIFMYFNLGILAVSR